MKARIFIFGALVLALGLTSCGGEETDTDGNEQDAQESCMYSYNEGTTTFEWVAYKTTAKKGVPGSFNEIEVSSEASEDPMDVIKSLEFKMNTSSVETNDEGRNEKIAEHFFGTINTSEITGNVKSVNDDGTAVIAVTMNGITFDVKGDYTMDAEEGKFDFNATINVESWNALAGITALNEVCKDLHTGDDGVSKLWSEVDLKFSTTLLSDCN